MESTTNAEPFLASPPPVVRLVEGFAHPLDNAVATARTCYSSRIVTQEEVGATERSRAVRDRIACETYAAGHHTTLQHATFQFTLERVSRQLVWSLLHAHPFYNSEQVSQRYVPVAMSSLAVPALAGESDRLFREAGQRAMASYEKLTEALMPTAEEVWFGIFPARRRDRERHLPAIRKKAMEAARYLLPVGTWTHLYHSVSGLTLHRYARSLELCDVPGEARLVIGAMVEQVRRSDPEFFRNLQDPVPLEETPEFRALSSMGVHGVEVGCAQDALAFRREFDRPLEGGRCAALTDWSANGEKTLADGVRHVLGVSSASMADGEALRWALDPSRNALLAQPLRLWTMDKALRSLSLVHYAFRKKLSHTADSQDQRHRMTPAARPVLARQYAPGHPDFVTPALVAACPSAKDFYEAELTALHGAIDRLLDMGVPSEKALYLLPNAFPVRFDESGDLMNLLHKWTTRLCLTAQEEIWRASRDEVSAVAAVHPGIARWVGTPCAMRSAAGARPFCPEGPRFCGVNAWNRRLGEIERTV